MKGIDAALKTFKEFITENQHEGVSEQVVSLSIAIAEASARFDKSTFSLYKKQSSIGDKDFSKLRVIGEKLLTLHEDERKDLVKRLPASYSTIHVLCGLKPNELLTGARSGAITTLMSVNSAKEYVKQVRFPALVATDGEKGRWGIKQEHLYGIYRPETIPLGEEQLHMLQEALRQVCGEYGVVLRVANNDSTRSLRQQERAERELMWRGVLEKQLTPHWFKEMPDEVKKEFNIRTITELHETPLRSFTGFLIHADGGRKSFWEKHGQAYVAKLNYLMEKTDDRAQRFNLKRRLEEVVAERNHLARWNNTLLKQIGFD